MDDCITADIDTGVVYPSVTVIIKANDIADSDLICRHLSTELRLRMSAVRQVDAVVVKEAVFDEAGAVEAAR